ncbi:MAG: hypothetical protein ACLPV4_04940 [Solirubrobacteraceae bacterium]
MSTGYTGEDPSQAATEEELRAAYEAEIKKIRIEQVLLEQVVTLINLGMRRTGLSPGTEDERDLDQVRLAIDSIRALMPLIDQNAAPQAAPIREALSQLQLAFVKLGGAAGPGDSLSGQAPSATGPVPTQQAPSDPEQPPEADQEPVKPGEPGPAQRSGRLWVPGQ